MDNGIATRGTRPAQRTPGVLVADDEPEVRDVIDTALRRAGFAVWLAADGQQALEVFRANRRAIDAALLDVNMPRLNGPQALAAIQKLAPRIPCCFMSGGLGAHTPEELRSQGALALLNKPFTFAAVIRAVRSLVDAVSSAPRDARRRSLVTTHSLQLAAPNKESLETAERSGAGNTRDARGP